MTRSSVILFLALMGLTVACSMGSKGRQFKPRKSFGGKREVLFVNADSMLYFIHPISYYSKQKNKMEVDYTYLFSRKSPDNHVKVCFTLTSQAPYEKINALSISTDSATIEIIALNLMYQEKKSDKKYVIRYNFLVTKSIMQAISNVGMITYTLNYKEAFNPSERKWKSQSETIRQSLQNM